MRAWGSSVSQAGAQRLHTGGLSPALLFVRNEGALTTTVRERLSWRGNAVNRNSSPDMHGSIRHMQEA
ncbi:protein of unknown function [Paraburkholderia dioscoreae]|uniref:Uncharacterized protein n=1 Tax=Paraburkholderia dioscoreae TaxID=2604047 RepID=A0A5Q4ZEM6_9BURK|nr:protein of unknown function [Paraburkholderia dioscoreae]